MNDSEIIKFIKEIKRELVLIPEGFFLMGSTPEDENAYEQEFPQHLVHVQSFLMGKFPVTQEQWAAVSHLSKVNIELDSHPSDFIGANLPIDSITWYQALEFCNRLSAFTGRDISLPSEAQWEYTCRAGTTTQYYCGDVITLESVNYLEEFSGSKRIVKSTPIGSYPPNPWGLYDMHGNVWEWCLDSWNDNYEGAPNDGSPWLDSSDTGWKVIRGGSWHPNSSNCRSAYRHYAESCSCFVSSGCRICCSI